ncbi:MAG: DUF2934 domain-containing protein [Planctomycetes bacterium]|nr:DUF2934 domain-containing protein [Planctomycetota bacterium]
MSRSSTTSSTAPQTGKTAQATATMQQGQTCGAVQGCVPADKVAALAFQKWLKKGCKHGQDQQDWMEAEAELKAEMARNGAKK